MIRLMIKNELHRVSTELDTNGYSLTSFDQLGLKFDPDLAAELCATVEKFGSGQAALELTKHIEKKDMTIVQDEQALALGRLMVKPAVDALFAETPRALNNWALYGVNRYETGGAFGAHQDSTGATVLIVTASGVRNFDVYKKGQDGEVERSFLLKAGSVMILDGQMDPSHAVSCIEGPSVSAVLDVPDLLRP